MPLQSFISNRGIPMLQVQKERHHTNCEIEITPEDKARGLCLDNEQVTQTLTCDVPPTLLQPCCILIPGLSNYRLPSSWIFKIGLLLIIFSQRELPRSLSC